MTNIIKEIKNENGRRTVIQEFIPITNKLIKETFFYSCGIKKEFMREYDQDTGKTVKATFYQNDGKTIDDIFEYDQDTGKKVKIIKFHQDGTIAVIKEFDKDTGHLVKRIFNFFDKEKITHITHIEENIYDNITGRLMKEIIRKPDGSIESTKEHRIDKVILFERFKEIEEASDNAKSRFSDIEDLNSEIEDIENDDDKDDDNKKELIEEKNSDKDDALNDIAYECDDLYPLTEIKFTKTINTEEREKITRFFTIIDDALYALNDSYSIEDNASYIDDLEDAIDDLKQFCKENDIYIVEDTNADENWDEKNKENIKNE